MQTTVQGNPKPDDITDEPLHEHDCDGCVYLGRMNVTDERLTTGVYDLYLCEHTTRPKWSSLIARHSSDGGDYWSTNAEGRISDPRLVEVAKRAQAHGLLAGLTLDLRDYNPVPVS